MSKAYVLVNCDSGNEVIVANGIRSVDNVLACNIVYGVYDIIVELEYDTIDELEEIVQHKIRRINQIQSTMTLIPFEFK